MIGAIPGGRVQRHGPWQTWQFTLPVEGMTKSKVFHWGDGITEEEAYEQGLNWAVDRYMHYHYKP